MKERREERERQKILKTKNLGDSDSGEDETMDWILKSRSRIETKQQQDKLKNLLKNFSDGSSSSDSEDPVALKSKKSNSSVKKKVIDKKEEGLSGLNLGHAVSDLESYKENILVLSDKPLIASKGTDDYFLNEDEDELENSAIREKEKIRHYTEIKSGKGKYNVYDTENDEILAKYNEDLNAPKKNSVKIAHGLLQDNDMKIDATQDAAKAMFRVEGMLKKVEASDFYSKEEIINFKKSQKKRLFKI